MRKKYQVKKSWPVFKSRFFWLSAVILLVTLGAAYLVLFWSFFQIKEVLVAGNEKISSQDIRELLWPKLEKKILGLTSHSIFLANPRSLQIFLAERFPLIDELKIKRQLPQFLTVDIKERKTIGDWCRGSDCFSLDGKGIVFEIGQPESGLIIRSQQSQGEIVLGKKVIGEKELGQILTIQKTLKEKSSLDSKEFTFFENELRLNVKTSENWSAYFDLKENLDWQLIKLELLLKKELSSDKRVGLEYVDLRFSKVYYK